MPTHPPLADPRLIQLPSDAVPKTAPPDLEHARAFIVQNLAKYRWYDTQTEGLRFTNPLRIALERVLSYCVHTDHRFLSREHLLHAALALMEMSWSQTHVLHLNHLAQLAFKLAETEYSGLLHPIARHLYHHNRIDSIEGGVYAVWGLFNGPIQRDVADAAIYQTETAWEPLRGLKEAPPFWRDSLEEMLAYQQACRVVSE